jgi:hypothetical protein
VPPPDLLLLLLLQQTTIPVSMPRIITDYVDSPYARSAPNAAEAAGKPIARPAAASRLSGPDGEDKG